MEKHQFEPFNPVLVRDHDTHPWRTSFFSHYMPKHTSKAYVCTCGTFNQCIPYNNKTAHLVGTNEPYKEPEPKVWHVINPSASFDKMYTNEELLNFIKTAVINNKDITNFHVTYINPND